MITDPPTQPAGGPHNDGRCRSWLKHFTVTGTGGAEFARVRKTWAGVTKEMLTPSDHYTVEFTGPVSQPARTLTVMMPIVLDLTLYGPV